LSTKGNSEVADTPTNGRVLSLTKLLGFVKDNSTNEQNDISASDNVSPEGEISTQTNGLTPDQRSLSDSPYSKFIL
jgi:hypothetical protein